MKKSFFLLFVIIFLTIFVDSKEFNENITMLKIVVEAKEQPQLQLGEYIQLGTLEKNILWRCVSQDENGLLMLSDQVLSAMEFGAEGNNCWSDSYVRKWLNSSLPTVKEIWNCRVLGTTKVEATCFLNQENFSDSQKSVIKPVTQKNLLAPGFPNKMSRGGNYEVWNQFSLEVIDPEQNGYYEIAYELLTDKIFCLDIKQMWDIYQNGEAGPCYNEGIYTEYWLRTPYGIPKTTESKHSAKYSTTDRVLTNYCRVGEPIWKMTFSPVASTYVYGVRPAFYLNEDTMIILSGDGSKENPYVVDGNGEPDVTVVVNEEILTFDQPPIIQNDRTLVPLRGIFEAMGAQVDWEEKTKTITAQKDETVVTLQVDSDKMYVNGELVTLDVPAIVMNDRTLVPLRAISEAFGATVEWEQPFRLATIKN